MSSLRSKIIISTLFIIFLVIAGSYFVIQDIQKGIIEGEFRDKGFLLADHLSLEFTDPLLVNDLIEIRNYIDNLKNSYPDIEYIFITDSEGIVLLHTFEKGFPEALQNRTKPINLEREFVYETTGGTIHEFDAPIFKNIGYVHIGLSENLVREQILEASRKLTLLTASAIVLGGLFAYVIGRRLTEPVLKLTGGARRINEGILDQKIEITTNDELGELARTFNEMALSLNQKINDLVTSKEQIETAEKYLETLFDSIEDGIIVLNSNHEIIKTNESFLKMMDLREENVLGKTCYEVIFGSKQMPGQADVCSIDTLMKNMKPVRFIHEAGTGENKKIFEINASLFVDNRGTANIILVIRDVTQQKILEEQIISRNRELTALNDISKNISESFDLDRILSKTIGILLEFTGSKTAGVYLKDDITGEYILRIKSGKDDIAYPVKEALTIEDIQKFPETRMESGKKEIRIPLRSKDNLLGIISLRRIETYEISPRNGEIFNALGSQIGVALENIIFYNNIKYLNEFNEEILNNVNLAIHVMDKDMNILAINNELLRLARGRIKKEEIINRKFFDAFPFLKEKNIDKEYEYVLRTGEIFQSVEKTEFHDDIIYTSTSKIPIKNKDGSVGKIITVIKDVSDQKRLEEELRDSYEELRLTHSKLKELYQIKDTFLSNISHELRTPLTSIMGYTELILDEDISHEQRHKLEVILRNSKRLTNLISMLLDTTLIESKNLQLDIQRVSIREIVGQVVEDMKTVTLIKNIPIIFDIPESMIINADKDRLIQVFSNVVDNAIKFTLSGEIRIVAADESENVHIRINDTGIGIPPDKLGLIFDRFYQLDSSKSRKYGGTGLGLWISKNIVEAHGGKIWAESKNTGSTFHILLPKRRKNE